MIYLKLIRLLTITKWLLLFTVVGLIISVIVLAAGMLITYGPPRTTIDTIIGIILTFLGSSAILCMLCISGYCIGDSKADKAEYRWIQRRFI